MHIGAHFILFYQDFILLISSLQPFTLKGMLREGGLAQGAPGVKRCLASGEGEPCEWSIDDDALCDGSPPVPAL